MERKVETRLFPWVARGTLEDNYIDDLEVRINPDIRGSGAWFRFDDLPERYMVEDALMKQARFDAANPRGQEIP